MYNCKTLMNASRKLCRVLPTNTTWQPNFPYTKKKLKFRCLRNTFAKLHTHVSTTNFSWLKLYLFRITIRLFIAPESNALCPIALTLESIKNFRMNSFSFKYYSNISLVKCRSVELDYMAQFCYELLRISCII